MSNALCIIFVIYIVLHAILIYVLLKISCTRNFEDKLRGKEYIINILGKYSGSKAAVKIITSVVAVEIAEHGIYQARSQMDVDRLTARYEKLHSANQET